MLHLCKQLQNICLYFYICVEYFWKDSQSDTSGCHRGGELAIKEWAENRRFEFCTMKMFVQQTADHVIVKHRTFALRSLCEEHNLVPQTDLGLDLNLGWSTEGVSGFGTLPSQLWHWLEGGQILRSPCVWGKTPLLTPRSPIPAAANNSYFFHTVLLPKALHQLDWLLSKALSIHPLTWPHSRPPSL